MGVDRPTVNRANLFAVGTRIVCSINHIDEQIIGTIIQLSENGQHYRVAISEKMAEKFKVLRPSLWQNWKTEGGRIWLRTDYARKVCRLNRHAKKGKIE